MFQKFQSSLVLLRRVVEEHFTQLYRAPQLGKPLSGEAKPA